jgi:hypothetical protein
LNIFRHEVAWIAGTTLWRWPANPFGHSVAGAAP